MRVPRGLMLFLLVLVSLAASAQPASTGSGQAYPARPVRVLIPFTAGSAADIIARAMEPAMRERLGQPFVIDNRGGAGGNIAAELTARATPDGHTIMMATIGTHAINSSLYSKLSFHPQRDFTPVGLVAESPNALVINPKVQATSIQELIALARSKPGGLNYGSSGAGTTVHLSAELFSVMTGIKMTHVPHKGAAEALTSLLGGQTDLMFASLSSSIPLIKAGRLRAFAVTGAKRSPSIPELPTVAEAAGLKGYEASAWFGIVGPAGMPKGAVIALNKAALSSLEDAEVRKRLFNAGVEIRVSSPEDFARYIESEMQKWAKVVKASGARAD
jgi:tripartite-type tricarboxylate transporter receptor subunit TctC